MKTISIREPWASLIVHGIKDSKNRTWACPRKSIGQRILIHANKRKRWVEPTSIFTQAQFDVIRSDERFIRGSHTNPQVIDSAIIGSIQIVDCVINHPSIWAEKTENYTVGMNPKLHEDITGKKVIYNWVLANPILFEKSIENVKGRLSFWDYPGIKEVKEGFSKVNQSK